MLNNGYGTQETLAMQSIAVLDLKTNQLADYPDKRFGEEVHQSYFLGLVFSSDGKHLYASVGSITDPTGQKAGDTGNGIAVYSFVERQSCARAIYRHRTTGARGRKENCDRFTEDAAGNRDSLSRGAGADFRWRPRSTLSGEQSFRQRCAAGCGKRQSDSPF